jgi:hypothetical protein
MRRSFSAKKSYGQRGYILVLMVFMTALLVTTTLAAGLWIKTDAKRQKEEEMIWRGKQYVRGIKLYVRKHQGQFPTSLDDLTKPGPGNVYYMRQAYKDPMNKEDGSWRLLYVGPNGQLIGSLKPQPTNLQFGPTSAQAAAAASIASGRQAGLPSSVGSSASGINPVAPPAPPGATPGGAPGSTGDTSQGTDSATGDSSSNPPPLPDNPNPIIGGKVIGVGSKVNQKSVKIYETAKNYRLFEFYWDPAKEAQAALQGAAVQAGAGQSLFGQPSNPNSPSGPSPFGPQPTNPSNPNNGPGIGNPPNGPPTQGPPPQP